MLKEKNVNSGRMINKKIKCRKRMCEPVFCMGCLHIRTKRLRMFPKTTTSLKTERNKTMEKKEQTSSTLHYSS